MIGPGPSKNRIGERFGPYQITGLLGRGGFAEVYLGKNVNLPQQEVAIKVLDKIMIRFEKVKQFTNEAAIILALQHPSIIQFYSYDVQPSATNTMYPYIVMEYAAKGSLRNLHRRGEPLPLDIMLTYIQQVAGALQYAHGNQVMHLDVKPENILVTKQSKLKLSDFGLATLATEQDRSEDIQGTLSYMAPEQFNGRPDKASDQYSLAVMVYEWICGSVPFSARSLEEYTHKLLNEPPPSLLSRVPSLSPAVETVVMKALSKNVKERYPSVHQFAEQLEKAITQPDASSAPKIQAIATPIPLPAPKNRAIAAPFPLPAPQKNPAEVRDIPAPQPQLKLDSPGAVKQVAPPSQPPHLQPPVTVSPAPAKQADLDASLPLPVALLAVMPVANLPVNQAPVAPDLQVASEADGVNPTPAAPASPMTPGQSPFLGGTPPGAQMPQSPRSPQAGNGPAAPNSPWVFGSPEKGATKPEPPAAPWMPGLAGTSTQGADKPVAPVAPWVSGQAAAATQGGTPVASTQTPFLEGKPPIQPFGAVPDQQSPSVRPASSPAKSPFLGASGPGDQRYAPGGGGGITIGPQPGFTYSQTFADVRIKDHPAPPSLPPYLGRPGNGAGYSEEPSLQESFSQSMHNIFLPKRRRRRSSPLFYAGIAANVIGAICLGVWTGRILPSPGNESAWYALIFSALFSSCALWLFDLSGRKIIKYTAATILAMVWGFIGYAFASVIGAGTSIIFLPDANIMAVLFLVIVFLLCIWKMFRRA